MKKFNYVGPIIWQKIGYAIFFVIFKIFVRIEIKGRNNLTKISGPIVLAANHTSELDAMALPLVLPLFSIFNPVYFVMNQVEKFKTFGWRGYIYGTSFLTWLGGYPIFSGRKNYAISLDNHIKLLRKGRTVCIFPEGKRTRDGVMNPARGGLGYLVYTTGATVIPVAIDTFFNMSFIDFITFRRKVIIKIGKPIRANKLFDQSKLNPKVEDFRHASQLVLDKVKEMMS